MPNDFALPSPDSDKNLKNDSAESRYCETECDTEQIFNLSNLQVRAIELTVQGLNDTQIADILSIERRTLWRWKTLNEEYRQVLATARTQVHASASDRCQNLLFRATTVLAKFLEDDSDKNRMRAAQILLQTATRIKPAPEKKSPAEPEYDDWPAPLLPPKVG